MRIPTLLLLLAGCAANESETPQFVHRDFPPDEPSLVDLPPTDEGGGDEGGLPPGGEGEGEAGPLGEGEGEAAAGGEGEGEGEPPCVPVDELCNDQDDDCDQEVDEGLECDACRVRCPVGALPSDVELCVAVEADQGCPGDYPTDLGELRAGTPALDLACTACTCSAVLTPIHYDLTEPACGLPFQRDDVPCDGVCEADLCGDDAAGHAARLVLETEGGSPNLDAASCTVQDEVTAKLCCRDDLPERPAQCDLTAFPGRLCAPPAGARGPLLVRETAAQPAVCARDELPGGVVFTALEVQGGACAPCPCQAEATLSFCDGEGETLSCTATGAAPACQTECMQRPDPERPVAELTDFQANITVARSGEAPAVTAGECVPTDARWVCDPAGVLIP